MYIWHKVGQALLSRMKEHCLAEYRVGEKKVGLVMRQGQVYAFSATCPHAGAPLCEGWVDGLGRVVCPLHHYRFDPANGRNTSGEGYKLFTYPVSVKNDEIYIGLLL